MFERYKNRMAHVGTNMSEMLRVQSNMVIEQTWDRDPNYRRVYVVKADKGLPVVTANHELIDVKFNVDTYQKVGSNEPAYHLQFKQRAEKFHPEIRIGSYVYMQDEDEDWKWWMIVSLDERPAFRQYSIIECNWKFGWIVDGKIYYHLGILRSGSSNREADENSYTSVVNGNVVAWMATNAETQLIGHDQRFLISDAGRTPPLCYSVSTISDTMPLGITKFVMSQSTFDPSHDNAELMLCNYDDSEINPETSTEEPVNAFAITYNGTKPSVKVGGSAKVFTAQLPDDNTSDVVWSVSDGANVYTDSIGDYTMITNGDTMRLKIASNYELIGTVLTIKAQRKDGSYGEIKVEVI
jgi:hypothetical protein